MKSLLKKSLIIAPLLIILIPNIVFGDTYITGIIDENQTWSEANSPYRLSNIYIEPNVTVSVDPGVEVYVDGYIAVFGTFSINGSPDNMVTFDLDPNAPMWEVYVGDTGKLSLQNSSINWVSGINVDSGNLSIKNTSLSNIFSGIVGINNSTIDADKLIISNLINGTAITVVAGSKLTLSNSKIEDSLENDSYLIAGYQNSFVNISNSELIPTLSIPIIMVGGELNASGLVLEGGLSDGINLFPNNEGTLTKVKASLVDTHISNFEGNGVFAVDPNITISDSEIVGNNTGLSFIGQSGASVSVLQSSIESNSTGVFYVNQNPGSQIKFDIRSNWWGDKSGPLVVGSNDSGLGDSITVYGEPIQNILYSPWLNSSPDTSCCSNVIFLPGIQGSRLYTKGLLENQLWEPNRNADVEKLYLNQSGASVNTGIYTRDIIERSNIGKAFGLPSLDQDVYKGLIISMNNMVSEGHINEWKPFPYDWRFTYDDLIVGGVKLQDQVVKIVDEVVRMSGTSKSGKVTLITHSNGGLLAKALINHLDAIGKSDLLDRLIMVAAPQLGTPDAIGGLLHGDNQDISILLSKSVARGMGENMKSAYNLIPSQKYFESIQEPVVLFDPSVDKVSNLRTIYGDTITTYDDLIDFLIAGKDKRAKPNRSDIINPNVLNNNLIIGAKNVHTNIDLWTPPENLEIIEIAGWGIETTKTIKYLSRPICLQIPNFCITGLDHESIKTIDGDGRVVSESSTASIGEDYYLNMSSYNNTKNVNLDHTSILEVTSLLDFIDQIIKNQNSDLPEFITKEKPTDPTNPNIRIAMHSPVSISAVDELGRRTGVVELPGSDLVLIEKNIPNSNYEEVGEGKYITINGESTPSIELKGLDTGTFTLNVTKSVDGGNTEELEFVDIPTNPNMEGELLISATSTSLVLDIEGDGNDDVVVGADTPMDPKTYLTIIKKSIDGFDINPKVKKELTKRIDAIIKLIEKNKLKNAIKKIKDFNKSLKSIGKHKHDRHGHKKLNKTDAQAFINMLNELLNLLESK